MSDHTLNHTTESNKDQDETMNNQAIAELPSSKRLKTVSTTTTTTHHETGIVTILDRGPHHVVVFKPHSVICHHSPWSGSKKSRNNNNNKKSQNNSNNVPDQQPEAPMLQRVREVVGQRVNLIHRLDRGASGCLLFAIPPSLAAATTTTPQQVQQSNENGGDCHGDQEESVAAAKTAMKDDVITSQLIEAHRMGQKTYLALVRGEGILHGQDFKQQGWFSIDRPIKDEKGNPHDALTWFRFVAGQASVLPNNSSNVVTDGHQDAESGSAPTALPTARASLVLARPHTGRWHQIRKHLNGLSHPILGDGTHGNGPVNREWKEKRGLLPERICLHLLRMQIPADATSVLPDGLNVTCPVPMDLWNLLEEQLPDVLQQARTILEQEEGIILQPLKEDGSQNDQFVQVPYHVTQTFTTKRR